VRVRKGLQERGKGFDGREAETILAATLRKYSDKISIEMASARRWVPWICTYSGARVTVRDAHGQTKKRWLTTDSEFRDVLRGEFGLNMSDEDIDRCVVVLHHKVFAIALANKLARIAWAVLAKGRAFELARTDDAGVRPV
jgi:hypothetical protein